MNASVRRVNWDQCTLLSPEMIGRERVLPYAANASTAPDSAEVQGLPGENLLKSVQSLLARIKLDENVPLYVAGVDGRLLHVSRGYEQLARSCDTADSSLSDRRGNGLPAGLLAVIREIQLIQHSVLLEEQIRIGGKTHYYRSRHFPVTDDQGRLIGVAGTYLDCTKEVESLEAAKLAQARFRDFARASSDWFWETDREGRLTMLSERLTALLGLPAARFLGQPLEQVGQFRPTGDRYPAREAVAHNRPFRDQVIELTDHAGRQLIFQLSGVPVFDPVTGDYQGYRGAGMDVTARTRALEEEQEIQRDLETTLLELTSKNLQLDMASAEAEQALKIKNEFLAAMSHELRTPLNAIIGFAEAMKMELFGELNDHYKSYSNDILQAGHHLLGLINDVLDVAVLESHRVILDEEPISLREIIDGALNFVIMRANKKNLDTSAVQIASDRIIHADARRVTQIFVNLFANAVKFTPEGGRIGVDLEDRDDGYVAVTVWDSGIGIPEDKQQLVFEKFQQIVDNIYSRREEGTGLGLHISRHLAQLMGGDLTLQSEVGVGSRFTVTLPLYLDSGARR